MADHDVAVVGAGPAGLTAAVTAAEHGLRVVLVDAAQQPGGQFWRHPDEETPTVDEGRGHHQWRRFVDLRRRLRRLEEVGRPAGRVTTVRGHQVWMLERHDASFTLHLTPTVGGSADRVAHVDVPSVVLCTGGYDRQLPVPGWDLPGVMAAGGVQALIKGHRTVAGRRAVVAGTGPFLLPVATGLAEAGAHVVAVCEASSPFAWGRTPVGSAAQPSKAVEAAGYAVALARHRIPYRPRTVVSAVHGDDRADGVTVRRLGRDGGPRAGARSERLDADLVALGWGFTPSLELVTAVGASTRVDADESLVAEVDGWQRSDVRGVYVAGEATGVGGASLAVAEGQLAGLAVASDAMLPVPGARVRALQRRIGRGRRFAAAMHRAHPVPGCWQEWLTPGTTVCRCEEVTYADVCAARDALGAVDARTLKLLARPGMGWCQGRVCGYAAARLARGPGARLGVHDLAATMKRTFATPVSLAELADGEAGSSS